VPGVGSRPPLVKLVVKLVVKLIVKLVVNTPAVPGVRSRLLLPAMKPPLLHYLWFSLVSALTCVVL
jgi:hypothetical protein